MTYRLNPSCGDAVAVPQLVFHHLARAGGDQVRVALYIVATGCTDPRTIAHDLKLKTVSAAQSAMDFWHGVGLLEKETGGAAPPP
ncbi:MAG TPA: DNA replication protein DnaD, partial [Candidatus Fournierella merdigallinarum]|nr:DNA replication protein DnaD [Candidatus Fournierella merdigallinarum]